MKLFLAACLTVSPVVGHAQTVRGVVIDQLDRPLAGVVMQLVDSSSRVTIQALTNERGEYRLTGPAAGRYTVRSIRIGFRPTTRPVSLRTSAEVMLNLAMTSNPVILEPVRSTGQTSCRVLGLDSTAATFAAWEQVRAALTATDITASGRELSSTTLSYDRRQTLTGVTIGQTGHVSTGAVAQPWHSVSADSLRKIGYVVMDADGETRVFHGPDVGVLVSRPFAEDHCFHLVGSADSARIGVAFEPTSQRGDRPEIRGVVWLDRSTAELRDMEWQYVNIARNVDETATGGAMHFARLASGAWVIARWHIRMPLVEMAVTGRESTVRFRGEKITGGELLAAVSSAGDTLFRSAPVTLRGFAFDSLTRTAMSGALVGIDGSKRAVVTDSSGSFEFRDVTPGAYRLITQHEALEAIGVSSQATTALVTSGEEFVNVAVPSFETIWRLTCESNPPAGDTALVYGTVRGLGRPRPIAGAAVIATWVDIEVTGKRNFSTKRWHLDGHTDSTGSYVLCGVPTQTGLRMRAVSDSGESGLIDLLPLGRQLVQRQDLTLSYDPRARGIVTGTVFGRNAIPIGGARVVAEGADEVRTDARGRFTIRDMPLGTQQVEVLAVGLQPVNRVVDVSLSDTARVEIHLTSPVVLRQVNIVASSVRQQLVKDFGARRVKGIGVFRDSTDFVGRGTLNSVLGQVPGVTLYKNQVFFPKGSDTCVPIVWIDGVHVQSPEDLMALRPSDFAAMELYPRELMTPPQYIVRNSRTPQCGAIVAWTKWYWEGNTQSRPPG